MHGVAFIKKDIEALIEDFYRVTGIRVAFISHDQSLWIEYPREKSLFCSILRKNPEFEEQCRLCDKKAFDISYNSETLYIYECHAGLIEAVSPIFHEGKLLGYMMLGQTLDRIPNTELWERISLKYNDYIIDLNELEQAFYKLKCFDGEVLRSAARIMDISAKYIHSSKMVKLVFPRQNLGH
jgi:ligand-binding sensor protein